MVCERAKGPRAHVRWRRYRGVFAIVTAVCARATNAATWPLVKNIDTNVVEVENLDGGSMTVKSLGVATITADAVVFEGDAQPEHTGGAQDSASKRLASLESRLATLQAALAGKETALDSSLSTCQAGKAALLSDLDSLEALVISTRFTPPTCTGANARNLIYVYDATLGYNVWKCVCKNDYNGDNCQVAPCDVSGYTLAFAAGSACAGRSTLSAGESCDIGCADTSVGLTTVYNVQSAPLKCVASADGSSNSLITPTCTPCDSCTSCIGPGETVARSYKDYTGTNCAIPPRCSLTAPGDGDLGTCGSTLDRGKSCVFGCAGGYFISRATTCSYEAVATLGKCLQFLWEQDGETGSMGLRNEVGLLGSARWNQGNNQNTYNGNDNKIDKGSRTWYYVAYHIQVDKDGYYHVGTYADSDRENDVFMIYGAKTFDKERPGNGLSFGNDYAQKPGVTFNQAIVSKWWDDKVYGNRPTGFVYLKAFPQVYTALWLPYDSDTNIPAKIKVVCGNPDRDGSDTTYGYDIDQELLDDTTYERGACTMSKYAE